MAVQPRRIRGAVLLGLCLCSIWTFSAQQAFTKTEVIEETDVSTGVKLVAEHPLLFSFLSMALCGALCCTENSATPRQGNAEDRADYNSLLVSASGVCSGEWKNILCFASGIVNALTIIDMGMTVSHQSGNTSHTGRLIMNGGAKFGHLLASFCFGSFFAGFSKSDCEAIYSGLTGWFGGIQNGITRRCLSLPICTTHFTGYLTDVGTGFGAWARATMNGEKPPTLLKVLLFFAGTLFFLLGGVAAKELHGPYNMQGALVAAGLMGAISAGLVPVVYLSEDFAGRLRLVAAKDPSSVADCPAALSPPKFQDSALLSLPWSHALGLMTLSDEMSFNACMRAATCWWWAFAALLDMRQRGLQPDVISWDAGVAASARAVTQARWQTVLQLLRFPLDGAYMTTLSTLLTSLLLQERRTEAASLLQEGVQRSPMGRQPGPSPSARHVTRLAQPAVALL
eukprot:g13522.t1